MQVPIPPQRPVAPIVNPDNIPQSLKDLPQWTVWRYILDPEKGTYKKLPIDVATRKAAKSNDPDTWTTFEEAYDEYVASLKRTDPYAGLQFAFSADDPYVGIDLDDCINEDGQIATWASEIIASLNSYAEISPSGTGVKIWVEGELAKSLKLAQFHGGAIEMYSEGRFFTVTGHKIGSAGEVRYANGNLTSLIKRVQDEVNRIREERAQRRAEERGVPVTPIRVDYDTSDYDDVLEHYPDFDQKRGRGYAEAALRDECSILATAPNGGRNNQLHESAVKMRKYIEAGFIDQTSVVSALALAASQIGLSAQEVIATINSAFSRSSDQAFRLPPPDPDVLRAMREKIKRQQQRRDTPRTSTLSKSQYVDMPAPHDAPAKPVQFVKRWVEEDELYKLQPPRFLVDEIVVFGEVTVVYGLGDTGKTFIVLDMAMRVAQHYPIMYVAGEDAPGIRLRKEAWCAKFRRAPNGNFRLWPDAIMLQDDASVDEFILQNKVAGSRLIIIDTLSQCSSGADENNAKEMAIVMRNATRIAHECQASVIIIHHTEKNGGNYRGSSTIKDNTYAFLKVTRNDTDISLECVRIKNVTPFKPRRFRLVQVPVELQTDEGVKTITSCVIAPANKVFHDPNKLSTGQGKVLHAMSIISQVDEVAQAKQVADYVGLQNGALYDPIKALLEGGYIDRVKQGQYKLTPKGRRYLENEYEESGGGRVSRYDGDEYFSVNPNIYFNSQSDSQLVSQSNTQLSGANFSVQGTENQPISQPDSQYNTQLRNELRIDGESIELPAEYEVPFGFGETEIGQAPEILSTENLTEKNTDSQFLSSPTTPFKGVGGGETENVAEQEIIPDPLSRVDWTHVRRLYSHDNIKAIETHCAIRRVQLEDVLARLQEEGIERGAAKRELLEDEF